MSEVTLKEWVNDRLALLKENIDQRFSAERDHADTIDRLRADATKALEDAQDKALALARQGLLDTLATEHTGNQDHFKILNGHAEALIKNQLFYVQSSVYDRDLAEVRRISEEIKEDIDQLEIWKANLEGKSFRASAITGGVVAFVSSVLVGVILRLIFP